MKEQIVEKKLPVKFIDTDSLLNFAVIGGSVIACGAYFVEGMKNADMNQTIAAGVVGIYSAYKMIDCAYYNNIDEQAKKEISDFTIQDKKYDIKSAHKNKMKIIRGFSVGMICCSGAFAHMVINLDAPTFISAPPLILSGVGLTFGIMGVVASLTDKVPNIITNKPESTLQIPTLQDKVALILKEKLKLTKEKN